MELGHPAIDLSIAHSFLPLEAHDAFRHYYGEISQTTWELARVRAIYSLTMIVVYAKDIGDENLKREGLSGLHFIEQAIG